jgi:hypothetical protein
MMQRLNCRIAIILAALVWALAGQNPKAFVLGSTQNPGNRSVESASTETRIILVDDFEPQPIQGEDFWKHNRLGGDRNRIDGPGGGTIEWGKGMATATISGGTNSWMGVWTSLNHPISDCAPLNFSSIFPPWIKSEYQGMITEIRVHVLDGQGDFQVELQNGEGTYCPPQIRKWGSERVNLTGGEQDILFALPPGLGEVQNLNWLVLGGAGDFVVVDRVELVAVMPIVEDVLKRSFLWSYGMLLNNWDATTGLTRDSAYWANGGFDNVSASGMQAAAAVTARRLGIISETSAVEIVTKISKALISLPRDGCGGNLWPHFVRNGQIIQDTEWSSIDTAIASVALIQAQVALGLDSTESEAILNSVTWDNLVLPDGHISHGYWSNCQPIEGGGSGGWRDFGTESWLVNYTYAAATGELADFDHTPPSFNGSGFIDELAWLLLPAPCQDRWGTEWNTYRRQAAVAQIAYYDNYACYNGPPRLFGLSAAEVPDLSAVPNTQIYQAFGVGGEIAPNDGTGLLGHAVIIPHYAGLVSSLHPDDARALWSWMEEHSLFTPLNNVESMMLVDEPICEDVVWNGMKGSWNLSLQTLGLGNFLARGDLPLYEAMWKNDLLRRGYQEMGAHACQVCLPLILK